MWNGLRVVLRGHKRCVWGGHHCWICLYLVDPLLCQAGLFPRSEVRGRWSRETRLVLWCLVSLVGWGHVSRLVCWGGVTHGGSVVRVCWGGATYLTKTLALVIAGGLEPRSVCTKAGGSPGLLARQTHIWWGQAHIGVPCSLLLLGHALLLLQGLLLLPHPLLLGSKLLLLPGKLLLPLGIGRLDWRFR